MRIMLILLGIFCLASVGWSVDVRSHSDFIPPQPYHNFAGLASNKLGNHNVGGNNNIHENNHENGRQNMKYLGNNIINDHNGIIYDTRNNYFYRQNSKKQEQVASVGKVPLPRDESVDNYIKMVLENFADAMLTGIPILGIPVLDPFNITKLELPEIDTGAITMKANASDISVTGTSSFTPTYVHVDFENDQMSLNLHFLEVRVDGQYWCDGLLLQILPVFGDGAFYIDILAIDAGGLGGILVTDDDHLQITELKLELTFDRMELFFDNFLGGGSFGEEMNEALDALGDTIIEALLPLLNNALIPALLEYVNHYLMEHTIQEIIDGALPGPIIG